MKPPLFNKIKSNRPFGEWNWNILPKMWYFQKNSSNQSQIIFFCLLGDCPVYTADPTDKALCECDPESNQTCGEGSDCINR